MIISNKACCFVGLAFFTLFIFQIIFSPAIYFGILNYLGPSTEYYEPTITGAMVDRDGNYSAYLGDKIFVNYIVVRHKINGECLLHVYRYGEDIGGPDNGKRHLLDYVELQFKGRDELMRPHWPLKGLVLGYDVNEAGVPQENKPLLAPGVNSQKFALYVVARYYCNFMDLIFPRYLQGDTRPDETRRVDITIMRRKS
jgi:hypothetical protein